MKIITKFNVGDKVYTLDKNSMKLKEFEIETVIVTATAADQARISYYMMCDNCHTESYDEKVCFASKDDLLAYITTYDKI